MGKDVIDKIEGFRLLNLKVILDNETIIYEGPAEEAEQWILDLYYSKIGNLKPSVEIFVKSKFNDIGELKSKGYY